MEDDVLSDAAKLAINHQLKAVLVPTGIVASVLAFLLGFFVNQVARSQAYTDALQGFAKQIQDASTELGLAKAKADAAAAAAERSAKEVDVILASMRRTKTEHDALAAEVKQQVDVVKTATRKLQEDLKTLDTELKDQLKTVRSDVSGIEKRVDLKLDIARFQASGIDALEKGDTEGAKRAFREAAGRIVAGLRESPRDLTLLSEQGYFYKNQAMMYRRSGKRDEADTLLDQAESSFQTVLRINPEDPGALNGMGSVCALRGDLDRAEKYVRKALEILPDYQYAREDLEMILKLKERNEKRKPE